MGGRTETGFDEESPWGRFLTVFSLGSMSETVTGATLGSGCSTGAVGVVFAVAVVSLAVLCVPDLEVDGCAPLSFAGERFVVPAFGVARVGIKY